MSEERGNFIVVFKKEVTQDQVTEYVDQVNKSGGKVTNRFDLINGFSAELTPASLASLQSATNVIDYIEPDGPVSIQSK